MVFDKLVDSLFTFKDSLFTIDDSLFTHFLIGIHSMQGRRATKSHEVTRKRSTKRLKQTGNLFRDSIWVSVNCRLKAI